MGLACGVALISATFFTLNGPTPARAADAEVLVLFLTVLAVMLRQFPQKANPQPLPTMAFTVFGAMYVPFLFNFITKLAFAWHPVPWYSRVDRRGVWLVFYLVAVVKATDIGAYVVGSAFGRHKLFPRISPAKTWEGVGGGIVFGLGMSLAFWMLERARPVWGAGGASGLRMRDAAILGLILAASGIVGDLVESQIKRAVGAKDSGRMVPGIGGVLDTIDSLLVGAPVLYFYWRWFVA